VSSSIPGRKNEWRGSTRVTGAASDEVVRCNLTRVDEKFLETFDLYLLAGRNYSSSLGNQSSVIVTAETVKQLKLGTPEEALGTKIELFGTREIIGVVAGTLVDPADFNCDVAQYLKPGGDLLWAQMDCVMGKLWGFTIKPGSGQPNMLLAASAFGMLGGIAFNGATGVFIFLTIIGVLYTLFSTIIKTMAAYVNGFILVTVLIIIAPIFLPLMLLQVTTPYFDKWWKGMLAAMLLPVMVSTYFVIAMLIYDQMLFKPNSLVQQLFDTEFMKKAQIVNSEVCTPSMVQDQALSAKGSGMSELARLPLVSNKIFPLLSGTSMTCYEHPKIQLTQEDMQKILIQLMQLFILSYLVAMGFQSMQQLVRNFGSSMTSATMDPVSSQERRLSDAMDAVRIRALGAQDEQGKRFADASGADFIRAMPRALKGGADGFIETMGDSKVR
ncbi:MAG: hypothetical protein ACK529_09135, partial [Alphaproteobacteria bacterium]